MTAASETDTTPRDVTAADVLIPIVGYQWADPVPLREVAELPEFPVARLPGWLREWVEHVARSTQTPADMAAMISLAAVSVACARRVVIVVRAGWREPVCIYTIVVLPSGERKSAVFRLATAPIEAYERDLAERLGPEVDQASATHRTAEQRLRGAEQRAAKTTGPDAITARAELADAVDAEREARLAVPSIPRLVASDATPEALTKLIATNGSRIGVLDAEGVGPLNIAMGRYSSTGAANLDVYLRAHAGDTIRVDRSSGDTRHVTDPALTLALTTQPEVLRQLGERSEARGLGFLARVLWSLPTSRVGRRDVRPPPMPDAVVASYAHHVRDLLAMEPDADGAPHVLTVSTDADDLLAAFQAEIEPQLAVGGDLAPYRDWCSKLPGAVARIAALLHCGHHGQNGHATPVHVDTMADAIAIGRYLLAHAKQALAQMASTDPLLDDACHVLDWLRAREIARIAQRDLWRAHRGRFRRSGDIQPALDLLADRGWIRINPPAPTTGPGRKPSPIVETHPAVRDTGHNGHFGHNPAPYRADPDSGHSGQSGHGVDAVVSL